MMSLKDFSLLKEDYDSYHVGHPHGKAITVPKKGLSDKAQKLIEKLKKHQNFADGTPDAPIEVEAIPQADQAQETDQEVEQDVEQAPEQVSLAAETAARPQAPVAMQPDITAKYGTAPLTQAMQTIQAGAQAEAQVGKTEADTYKQAADQIAQIQNDFNVRRQEYMNKNAQFENALLSQKIDPDRYWKNMDTGAKITSAIALALGGIGAGLTRGPNYALDQVNRAVNNDIASQMNDQSKTMNLWKMNREALGDDQAATLATQNNLLSVAKVKAMQAQALAQGAIAKAKVAPLILQIGQQIQQNDAMRALLKMGQMPASGTAPGAAIPGEPAALVENFIQDKDTKKEALKELGSLQEARELKKGLLQSYNDLNSKLFAGQLSPYDRASAINAWAGKIAKITEGRFNLEEAKLQMNALMPQAGESEQTRANKLSRLNQFANNLVQTPTLNGTMLPIKQFRKTNLEGLKNAWLPGTVIPVNGKPHVVNADGETATPVK